MCHTISYAGAPVLCACTNCRCCCCCFCVRFAQHRRREGLLYFVALLCGGQGLARLELSMQREVWSSPLTHPTQHRQPAGDNSISHLKMRRQVSTHGWLPPAIGEFSYFPRRSGNISILKIVANARRRNFRFGANDLRTIFLQFILRCRRSFNVSVGLDKASCPEAGGRRPG